MPGDPGASASLLWYFVDLLLFLMIGGRYPLHSNPLIQNPFILLTPFINDYELNIAETVSEIQQEKRWRSWSCAYCQLRGEDGSGDSDASRVLLSLSFLEKNVLGEGAKKSVEQPPTSK